MVDILPDSRAKVTRGAVQGPGGMWIPIFCAHCGKQGGLVEEAKCTFAFWLCDPCFADCGHITGTWITPDESLFVKHAVDEGTLAADSMAHGAPFLIP